MRVIIADDHYVTREGTRRVLEEEPDIDVVGEASEGEETIRVTLDLRPDLLVLDVSMPRVNGIDVARELRKRLPELRIVVLTGYDNRQYVQALARVGVHGFLTKSASASQLVATIRAALARSEPLPANTSTSGADMERPTTREQEVLDLVARGLRNRQIAQTLGTSERTVQFHLANLFGKLAANSRTEVVHRAREYGWLP